LFLWIVKNKSSGWIGFLMQNGGVCRVIRLAGRTDCCSVEIFAVYGLINCIMQLNYVWFMGGGADDGCERDVADVYPQVRFAERLLL
jgi:hypothetical protein